MMRQLREVLFKLHKLFDLRILYVAGHRYARAGQGTKQDTRLFAALFEVGIHPLNDAPELRENHCHLLLRVWSPGAVLLQVRSKLLEFGSQRGQFVVQPLVWRSETPSKHGSFLE